MTVQALLKDEERVAGWLTLLCEVYSENTTRL